MSVTGEAPETYPLTKLVNPTATKTPACVEILVSTTTTRRPSLTTVLSPTISSCFAEANKLILYS